MVSSTTEFPSTVAVNRGFGPDETVIAAGPGGTSVMLYRPFWRPVVAGAVFALSVFALSWYLMLGCHVGIAAHGVVALGLGAAIWLWVTSCIAYFFGGLIASAITAPSANSGWLKGAVLWAFSIPTALVIYGLAMAQGGPLLSQLDLPHVTGTVTIAASRTGYHWAVFIGLGLALIFALVGSAVGCGCRSSKISL